MIGFTFLRQVAGGASRLLQMDRVTDLLAEVERQAEAQRGNAPPPLGSSTRELTACGIHLAGVGLATLVSVARAAKLPAAVPALVSAVVSVPQLRAVARACSPAHGEQLLAATESLSTILAGQPVGQLANAVHGGQRVAEARAREQTWSRRAGELLDDSAPSSPAEQAAEVPPLRPAPLPPGPVERYAAQAATAGLAGMIGGFVTAKPEVRVVALAGASAKAARLTKESWATRVGRVLAQHDVLIRDPQALRRLDRVDTVVLEAELLTTGRWLVDEVIPLAARPGQSAAGPGQSAADLYGRALALLELEPPPLPGWDLVPVTGRGGSPYRELARRVSPGGKLFTLRYEGRPVAAVAAAPELDPYAESVVSAAQQVGQVLVAGDGQLAQRLALAGAVPGGDRLVGQVRELQEHGHGVVLVGRAGRAALAAADVGVGVAAPGQRSRPVGQLICGPGLAQVPLLLSTVGPARRAARAGVLTASYGAAAGALAGLSRLGGPQTAGRNALLATQLAALAGIITGVWYADPVVRSRPVTPLDRRPWHVVPVPDVLRWLGSSRDGLSSAQAEARHHQAGDDVPPEGPVRATGHELDNPLTPALTAGAGLAAASGSTLDAVLIGTVLAVNGLVGGVQRWEAGRAIRRLASRTDVPLRLWRDGQPVSAPAEQLVLGDVIELRAGDAVPADGRIIAAEGLELDEASLTGESLPVAKQADPCAARAVGERSSMVYEGTAVAAGRARAAVVATGDNTESHRAHEADPPPAPGVAARLAELTTASLSASLAGGVALLAANLLRGRPLSESLTAAVSLTVAAVPEGLPSVAAVAQLSAANRLSKRGVLVRNPAALESLGRLQTLCFDKTGTLTEGRLRLKLLSDGETEEAALGASPPRQAVLAAALRASPPPSRTGRRLPHPTDQAVVAGGEEVGVTVHSDCPDWTRLDEVPFEPGRGFHLVLGQTGDAYLLSVKGAPEVVLEMCASQASGEPLTDHARQRLGEAATGLARAGYRVLAVAEGTVAQPTELDPDEVPQQLRFIGYVALADRARPAAAQAVETLGVAGVRVVMVTGDHPSTAEAVAAELGLLDGGQVLTGSDLDARSDAELVDLLPSVAVFARVDPGHKVRIVRLLRQAGQVVAVTGDGANDAPAIRTADVGLALGSRATPAARQAADVVVTDDRIETVVDAIVEGRILWSSVREAVAVLAGGNLGEVAFTVGAGLLGARVLRPRQLLLVNLLTDVAPAMALAARQPPGTSDQAILAEGPSTSLGEALGHDIRLRATATAGAAGAAWLAARLTGTATRASTVALIALVSAQLGQTLAASRGDPVVIAACVGSLAVLVSVVQLPGLSQLLGCRPVGPVGWTIALTAAAGSTLAARSRPAP